jgi:hypothetical protein
VNRLAIVAASVVTTLALAAPAADASEGSSTKRACNSINLGEPRVFYKHNMRCHKAKHYARRLYKTDGRDEPKKFACESGSNFNQGARCQHDFKNKLFGWHPFDKRKVSSQGASDKPKVACWNKTFPNEQGTEDPQFYRAPRKCIIFKRGAISYAEGVGSRVQASLGLGSPQSGRQGKDVHLDRRFLPTQGPAE